MKVRVMIIHITPCLTCFLQSRTSEDTVETFLFSTLLFILTKFEDNNLIQNLDYDRAAAETKGGNCLVTF